MSIDAEKKLKTCILCSHLNSADAAICAKCGAPLPSETTVKIPPEVMVAAGVEAPPPTITPQAGVLAFYIPGHEKSLQIPVKEKLVVGRGVPEAVPDIDLNSYNAAQAGVSRRHVILYVTDGAVSVEDQGSANGTWLNENRLEPQKIYPIHNGDLMRLGHLLMFVYFKPVIKLDESSLSLRDRTHTLYHGFTAGFLGDRLQAFFSALTNLERLADEVLEQPPGEVYMKHITFDSNQREIELKLIGASRVVEFLQSSFLSWQKQQNGSAPLPAGTVRLDTKGLPAEPPPMPPPKTGQTDPGVSLLAKAFLDKVAPEVAEKDKEKYYTKAKVHLESIVATSLEIAPK